MVWETGGKVGWNLGSQHCRSRGQQPERKGNLGCHLQGAGKGRSKEKVRDNLGGSGVGCKKGTRTSIQVDFGNSMHWEKVSQKGLMDEIDVLRLETQDVFARGAGKGNW